MIISLYNFLFQYWQWVRLFLHILRQYFFSLYFFYVLLFQGFTNISIAYFSVVSDLFYSHIFWLLNTPWYTKKTERKISWSPFYIKHFFHLWRFFSCLSDGRLHNFISNIFRNGPMKGFLKLQTPFPKIT